MFGIIAFVFFAILAGVWIYTGYRGWTWIPIGKIPRKHQIKIACVGDSITYGMLIRNWYRYNYPHVLQEMLGKKFCVHNYGLSGCTAMEDGDFPYVKTLRYKRSLSFCPDVLLLKFGTNDSKKCNWKGEEDFAFQYEKLLLSYMNSNPNMKIYLLTPATPHQAKDEKPDNFKFGIEKKNIEKINDIIFSIADKYGVKVIDIFSFTDNHPEWFCPDGIHPNAEGSKRIAQIVYNTLRKD